MHEPCALLEPCFQRYHQQVYRLCFVLTRTPEAAMEMTFQAFLRLGAAKEPPADDAQAKALLFSAAVRLCDDYFLKKPHRKVRRARLEGLSLPFAITEALWDVLGLSFSRRAAIGLAAAGFEVRHAADFLRRCGLRHTALGQPDDGQLEAVSSVVMLPEEAAALLDRIYIRFAERSVSVENALHGIRSAFDRIAPLLALLVLALFAFAYWFTS